jgi:hypothetical protein
MLSMLPGTSNSVANRTGLPVWLTSSAMIASALASTSSASLASTPARSTGVAVAQPRNAARADATARSTSAAVANAISATGAPLAGFTTWCSPPAVTTGAPSIQLLATSMDTALGEDTVMSQR